ILDMFICEGKHDNSDRTILRTIKRLTDNYANKWHTIYMDSYFSTLGVCKYLHEQKFNYICMINRNHTGLTKTEKDFKPEFGEQVNYVNDDMMIINYT